MNADLDEVDRRVAAGACDELRAVTLRRIDARLAGLGDVDDDVRSTLSQSVAHLRRLVDRDCRPKPKPAPSAPAAEPHLHPPTPAPPIEKEPPRQPEREPRQEPAPEPEEPNPREEPEREPAEQREPPRETEPGNGGVRPGGGTGALP